MQVRRGCAFVLEWNLPFRNPGSATVLCMTLISRIYTGDTAKIEAASSNKEAKRVEERIAEEVTVST